MASTPNRRKAKKGPPTSADPARLAKWLANPGLRSQLPDSLLSLAQRKQRAVARDPYHKAVEALTQQRFGQPIAQVQQAQRTQDQHTQNVGNWFGQYQAELARSRDRQKAMQDAATQSVADRTASFASMNNTGNQQDMAALQADAAARGATVGGQVAKTAGDANTIREALGKQSANTLATQGVSNNAAAEGALVAAYGEAALAKQREQDKRGALDTELRNIVRDRDAYKITARGDLVAAEQKAQLEAKAFGLDSVTKLNPATGLPYDINPKTGRPYPKPITESEKATRARNKYFEEHGYYPPTGPPKKTKGPKPTTGLGSLTAAQEQKLIGQIKTLSDGIATGKGTRRDAVAQGPHSPRVNRVLANAANDMAKLGYLSPGNVRALRAIGVHVSDFPRSKAQAREAGTLPGQRAGDTLRKIGGAVGGLPLMQFEPEEK